MYIQYTNNNFCIYKFVNINNVYPMLNGCCKFSEINDYYKLLLLFINDN